MANNNPQNPRLPINEQAIKALEKVLLPHGGSRVALLGPEPHLKELITNGKVLDLPVKLRHGEPHRCHANAVKLRHGEPHRCHANAAKLWATKPEKYRIVTGYVLVGGEAWVQHSWVTDNSKIYESICKTDRYFGVLLNENDAVMFWMANYLPTRYPKVMSLFERFAVDVATRHLAQSNDKSTRASQQ